MKTITTNAAPTYALPKGINASDTKAPAWDAKDNLIRPWDDSRFELWYTDAFGWVIPTLLISHASRRSAYQSDRTYAVRVSDGAPVRVGCGPHVKAQVEVYVRVSREKALRPYLDLRAKGANDANEIRDRISTRRAQGALLRGRGPSWYA